MIGLETALALHELGQEVLVIARQLPAETTSANAGAIWGPFLSPFDERLERWSKTTFEHLVDLSNQAGTGVSMAQGSGHESSSGVDRWWVQERPDAIAVAPMYGYAQSWRYSVPVIDAPMYLAYLSAMLRNGGVEIRQGEIDPTEEAPVQASHIVACTGIQSRVMFEDPLVSGIHGELVVIKNTARINEFICERGDGPDLLYIIPQGDRVVVGGSAHPEQHVPESEAQTILSRAARIVPSLASAPILEVRKGIRPCRASVRVEHLDRTWAGGAHIVVNYGHGGSGFSIGRGCALEAAQLVADCAQTMESRPM